MRIACRLDSWNWRISSGQPASIDEPHHISRTFSTNEQYFSFMINQSTVLLVMAYQPSEPDTVPAACVCQCHVYILVISTYIIHTTHVVQYYLSDVSYQLSQGV